MSRTDSGFTLVELLLTVAIMAVLISIAIPEFSEYRKKAYNAQAKLLARDNITALESLVEDFREQVVDPTITSNIQCYVGGGIPGGISCHNTSNTTMATADFVDLFGAIGQQNPNLASILNLSIGPGVSLTSTYTLHCKGDRYYYLRPQIAAMEEVIDPLTAGFRVLFFPSEFAPDGSEVFECY